MKKVLYLALASFAFACGQNNTQTTTTADSIATVEQTTSKAESYGDAITADSAITIEEMKTLMGDKKELAVKVTAPVDAVCQKKGCWMELKAADGTTMRVTFKDYGFFVPKDCSGKTATVLGMAKVEETSIADLKEYAKDDGQSEAEVAAITAPKKELVFEASGVILQ
jgi:hypothetical protein